MAQGDLESEVAWSCSLRCAAPSNADCKLAPVLKLEVPAVSRCKTPRAADAKKEAEQLEGLDHRYQLAQHARASVGA